jgi:hypothetical protein
VLQLLSVTRWPQCPRVSCTGAAWCGTSCCGGQAMRLMWGCPAHMQVCCAWEEACHLHLTCRSDAQVDTVTPIGGRPARSVVLCEGRTLPCCRTLSKGCRPTLHGWWGLHNACKCAIRALMVSIPRPWSLAFTHSETGAGLCDRGTDQRTGSIRVTERTACYQQCCVALSAATSVSRYSVFVERQQVHLKVHVTELPSSPVKPRTLFVNTVIVNPKLVTHAPACAAGTPQAAAGLQAATSRALCCKAPAPAGARLPCCGLPPPVHCQVGL